MLSQCTWCKKGTATDADILICFGCEKSYHGSCCSLTKPQVRIIKEVAGVKWFCLNCDESTFASMINKRFNAMDEKIDKIANDSHYQELLNQINCLSNEVSAVKLAVEQTATVSVADDGDDEVFGRKRLRSGRAKQTTTSNIPLWPLPKPGSSITFRNHCITGTDESSGLKVIEPKAWFHVSRFGPETTAEELKTYISEKISSDQVECYRLVAKGRDTSELRFVTFKIGVLDSSKIAIMDASIWPSNVSVRPFEQRSGFQAKYASLPSRLHQD